MTLTVILLAILALLLALVLLGERNPGRSQMHGGAACVECGTPYATCTHYGRPGCCITCDERPTHVRGAAG